MIDNKYVKTCDVKLILGILQLLSKTNFVLSASGKT